MTDKEKQINFLVSTIRDTEFYRHDVHLKEVFFDTCCDIMCQFDTDIAIAVFEKLGLDHYATAMKVYYGY